METTVKKTLLPTIAGILAIASGGFKLFIFLGLIIAIVAVESNLLWRTPGLGLAIRA